MFKPGYKWRTLAKTENRDVYAENSGSLQRDHKGKKNFYFDELVIDQWFHLEMMDENSYWMRVGEYRIDIKFIDGSDKPEVYVEKE
jgi:hypothetical protein